MAHRQHARAIVLQSLYELDFNRDLKPDTMTVLNHNIDRFADNLGVDDEKSRVFMEELFKGIVERKTDVDTIIEKAAPDWPINKISLVDRNILRLGLHELLFADRTQVPPKVAINEAIELAKLYGSESSGRFVNGVLGSVYKELGEPGKDQTSKKKKEVPFEEMPIEVLGGAVVYSRHEGEIYLALVHDVFGHWTLSKGGIPEGVDTEPGTQEEIKKEIGLDVEIIQEIGSNEYVASHPEKGKIRKQVKYFLAESPFQELKLGSSGGLDDAQWFKLTEVINLNTYDDILPIITDAINILIKQ